MSPAQLGVELRARRVKAGLTQAELAKALETTQPAVARIEAGIVVPSFLFVDRWVATTGYPLTVGENSKSLTPLQKGRLVRDVVGADVFDPWERLAAKRARGLNVKPERRYLTATLGRRTKGEAVRRG